jgi:hypothetical protein
MAVSTLPISRLIKVSISLAPQAAQAQNLNSLLVLGSSVVIDPVTRMRSYSSLQAVGADFGTTAPEYLAAVLWFEQNSSPSGSPASILIGRWVNAAAPAQLFGAPLTTAQQAASNFSGIAAGSLAITTSKPVPAPTIVASAVATYSTATYTLAGSSDTFSGSLNLQVGAGGTPFSVSIPAGTTLAAAVTLLNANTAFFTTNLLTASTAGATLIITGGAYGTGGTKTIIDTSVLVDAKVQLVTGIVLTGVGNMNAVASAITTALSGVTCTWNAVYGQFVFTTTATGVNVGVSFVSAAGSGTDISTLLGCLSTNSGAYVTPGAAAETALAAVQLFDAQFGQQWFGLTVIGASDSDLEGIAPYIEADANFHYHFVTTQEAGVLVANYTTDIASILKAGEYSRTMVQFSSTNPYAAVSAAAVILTTDYTANNSVIDLMYKQEPGITPENLNINQIATAESKNASTFVAYDNNTAIIDGGNSCNGLPAALVIGAMAFGVTLQTDLYNALYLAPTKIPQTDAGMHTLGTIITNDCIEFVNNGFFAPGTWTSDYLFGTLTLDQYLAKGYYLYTPAVATQSPSTRAASLSVPFQLAAKFSGQVREVNLAVTINQ